MNNNLHFKICIYLHMHRRQSEICNTIQSLQMEVICWFETQNPLQLQIWLSAARATTVEIHCHYGIWKKSTKNKLTLNFIQRSQGECCNKWDNPYSVGFNHAYYCLLNWNRPATVQDQGQLFLYLGLPLQSIY